MTLMERLEAAIQRLDGMTSRLDALETRWSAEGDVLLMRHHSVAVLLPDGDIKEHRNYSGYWSAGKTHQADDDCPTVPRDVWPVLQAPHIHYDQHRCPGGMAHCEEAMRLLSAVPQEFRYPIMA